MQHYINVQPLKNFNQNVSYTYSCSNNLSIFFILLFIFFFGFRLSLIFTHYKWYCVSYNYWHIQYYLRCFTELDIYPTRFSLHSKNHPLGSPVTRRDTVFVEVVSAVPKKLYWGQPSTHLLSHRNDMVTIEEKQPGKHQKKSGLILKISILSIYVHINTWKHAFNIFYLNTN